MPLYTAEFLATTAPMSCAETGAFLLLVFHQWERGAIPADPRRLARIARMDQVAFDASWEEVLADHFPLLPDDPSLRANPTVASRRSEALERVAEAKRRGQSGAIGRWGSDDLAGTNHEKRRARMTEAREKGRHTEEQWVELKRLMGYRCAKCGVHESELGNQRLTKDHVRLVSRGGDDSIANIQPMCRRCNSRKGPEENDYVPDEIRAKLSNLTVQIRPLQAEISMETDRIFDGSLPSPSPSESLPPSPNGDLPPEGASAVKSAEPEKPKKAGGGGGKRVAPEEPPLATLPAELEPFAKMLIAFLAKRNTDGRISTGRIATVRQKLAETLETVEGQWRYVAFGVQEAVSRDATDERYAITVAKRTFQRGSIPEWAQADIAKHVPDAPKARPRPPDDFNTWAEPKKDAWLRENGYV